MFSKISWSDFTSTIIFLSVIYYFAIIILYFRKDIMKWSTDGIILKRFNKSTAASEAEQPLYQKESTTHSQHESRPMSYSEMTVDSIAKFNQADVHELIEELKTILSSAQKKKMVKQELILVIHNKLAEYKQLKGTEIEKEIVQHIANECEEKCAIDLDKEDLENLWKL